tara:strand:+ start:3312 stop:4067 length:756 start_codon:yes stop_codon:yes gene_type:complete
MKNNNEKGFTLVLALVLLLVMSLMGGALIVTSASDHQSNNTSDEYQQAFYVAETGLFEAEKLLINQVLGPWVDPATLSGPGAGATEDELSDHSDYIARLQSQVTNGVARDIVSKSYPTNAVEPSDTDCFRSFKNIVRAGFLVTHHIENQNFGSLVEPIFDEDIDPIASQKDLDKELEHLKRFRYEYFAVNIGAAPYKGEGASMKKTSSNVGNQGTAYKVYACGMMVKKGTPLDKMKNVKIIVPLESKIIMP